MALNMLALDLGDEDGIGCGPIERELSVVIYTNALRDGKEAREH